MSFELGALEASNLSLSSRREWMLTDGRGGFAMGTAAGLNTRRYHGLWVPCTGPGLERMVMLAAVEATAHVGDDVYELSTNEYVGAIHPDGFRRLTRFRVNSSQAEWIYAVGQGTVVRTLRLTDKGCILTFENKTPKRVTLRLKPLVCHKPFHENFRQDTSYPDDLEFGIKATKVTSGLQTLVLGHEGAIMTPFAGWYYRFEHAREVERGLDPIDDLFCPCELTYQLEPSASCALTASFGDFQAPLDLEEAAEDVWKAASRSFIFNTASHPGIVAGYPWFGEWGRDTMIALPGILLLDGQFETARDLLSGYSSQLNQGLIPNQYSELPDHRSYNTVDGTFWFIDAIYQTLKADWNPVFASHMLEVIREIIEWLKVGTHFGIKMDPKDSLITQGEEGMQLTWMDAKVDGEVVTPRMGKPVEINALWAHGLKAAIWMCDKLGVSAADLRHLHAEVAVTFGKFWNAEKGWYFDTLEPDDASLRPNQVLAMGLDFSPCLKEHATLALDAVDQHLLCPQGLRTLAPFEPGYRGRFEGPISELDRAYHQGTVWPWLLGSYVASILKWTGDQGRASSAIASSKYMLEEGGLGGIAEVYDGDDPRHPSGCLWQAWSLGEIRRALQAINSLPKSPEGR